ncbi:hypothetical protein QCA50_000519 [Cerrena zonata]|uniref:Uncharacterized protein n=1 Tax=Cerrena zonata TaxID=2478898 RepID=A0AAW0H022_9APHY
MRVLASTYTPKDLNFKGFSLYADFRPEVNEWGKRGEVRCQTILDLRNMVLEVGEMKGDVIGSSSGGGGPPDGGEMIVNSTSRLDVVKVGKLDEMDGDVHDKMEGKGKAKDNSFEQGSHDEVRTEPDQKKVKIGADELADEDEYDAAFDDLGDIDLQHLP